MFASLPINSIYTRNDDWRADEHYLKAFVMNFSHAGHYTFYSCLLLKLEIKVSFMMGQWFCSIGLLTDLTLCPSLHCEILIILARKIKSPFFCASPPPIPFPYHVALKKRSLFGSPTFHHECRTALWCIFKQGLTHRMITLEENFIWLWACKRCIEI